MTERVLSATSSPLVMSGYRRLALVGQNRGCIDIQSVQGTVRVVPRAVRIVGPRRVGNPAVERQPGVVAVVDVVPGIVRVRRTRADLDVRSERQPTVCAERSPELGIVIRYTVGITRTTGAEVIAGVVPHRCKVPAGWIERDL